MKHPRPKEQKKKRPLFEDDEEDDQREIEFEEIDQDEASSSDDEEEEEEEVEMDLDDDGEEEEEPFDEEEADETSTSLRNPSVVWRGIEKRLGILSSFAERREGSKSRSEYLKELAVDLAEYYGYIPELVEMFLRIFGPGECVEFLDASDAQRPVVIRTNTLKTRRKDLLATLQKRGMRVEPVADWSPVGIKVSASEVPVGATPEYLAGHYMLQSAASLCPVAALDPKPGDRVLDVSSAPGGKTTHIAQLMKNQGTIVANDLKKDRQKATVANLHRLGVTNVVAKLGDGRQLPEVVKGFDRVLLDAPCTGLGVISRDPSIKGQRTLQDVTKLSQLQKQLLLAALDAAKQNAVVVYSTCSVSVEENEAVVQHALDRRHCKLVRAAGLDHGKPGFSRYHHLRFHPNMTLARRFYPHVHNMDGFFVAKLFKTENGPKKNGRVDDDDAEDDPDDDEDAPPVVVENPKPLPEKKKNKLKKAQTANPPQRQKKEQNEKKLPVRSALASGKKSTKKAITNKKKQRRVSFNL